MGPRRACRGTSLPSLATRTVKWGRRTARRCCTHGPLRAASVACVAALVASNIIVSRETSEKSRALEARTKAYAELRELREKERHISYLQGIALADWELRSGSAVRAERLLGEQPPGLRPSNGTTLCGYATRSGERSVHRMTPLASPSTRSTAGSTLGEGFWGARGTWRSLRGAARRVEESPVWRRRLRAGR